MLSAATHHLRKVGNFAGRYFHALALTGYTFTVGLASARRRRLISQLAREANYREFPRATLPSVSIANITGEFTSVVLPNPEDAEGGVALLELLVLARLARERRPLAVFEIGTFNGRSTVVLAANAPADATLYTLDLPPDHPTRFPVLHGERAFIQKPVSGQLIQVSPQISKIRRLFGDSGTFDFTAYQADLVFVDGSHAYDYVMSDSLHAVSMLRGGKGMVIWHDYGEWEGVTRALNDLARTDTRFADLRHVRGTTLVVLELT